MRLYKERILLEQGEPCVKCLHYIDPVDTDCPLIMLFKLNEFLSRLMIKVEACGHYKTRRKEVL